MTYVEIYMETSRYIMANIKGSKFIEKASSWKALRRGIMIGLVYIPYRIETILSKGWRVVFSQVGHMHSEYFI